MTARRFLWAAVLAAAGAGWGRLPAARAADDPAAPAWEQEVERETREQTRQIEQAKRAKTMRDVVAAYANRVSRDGETALNCFLYGRALYHADDATAARNQMKRALQQDPRFWPAHVKLAQLAIEAGNWAEAESQIAAALQGKPTDLEALETAWRLSVQRKEWEAARRRLETYLSRSPGSLEARQALALVHLERKDWDGALREARLVVQADPKSPGGRFVVAAALRRKGDLAAAAKELEALAAEQPQNLQVLDELRAIAVQRKDAPALISALGRMLPLLAPDKQRQVAVMLEALRKDPQGAFAVGGKEAEPHGPTLSELVAEAQNPDVARRRAAIQALYDAVFQGEVKQVPGALLRRMLPLDEPDPDCRKLVVRISGHLGEPVLPMVALVLHDEDRQVRMLAAETLGDSGSPVAVVYLLHLVLSGDAADPLEFETLRAALAAATGTDDLPAGKMRVTTADDVAVSREAWRRWMISDASSPPKIAGIRRLIALKDTSAEWYLYDFVMDPNFEVMREAYVAMREATKREPRSPVERKVFPTFPRVEDADVTRPAMRAIQDRVAAWRSAWAAENRADLEAKGK